MKTLADRLQFHATKSPESVAVYLQRAGQTDVRMSYAQLVQRAAGYARAYRLAGIRPGEVVVLIMQHGEDLVYAFWGAILHGVIPSIMPFLTEKLSPEQYRADLAALISVTRPAAIVTYPQFESEVHDAVKDRDSVRRVIVGTQLLPASSLESDLLPEMKRRPEDIVLLQHSSGTTGLQKGVALTHQAVLNQLDTYSQTLHINAQDVIVSWLPLYHDMGLIAGFLMPIMCGIPLVLSSPFDWVRAPWRLLRAVSQYKGTLSWLPNFAYNFLAQKTRDRELEGVDLSTWRAVINCSEPVRWESHRAFFDRFHGHGLNWESLQTSYAMAENVFGVTQSELYREPTTHDLDREGFVTGRVARPAAAGASGLRVMSSGRPLSNTRVRVVDEQGNGLEDRRVGEIALQSDCMLIGYYNRPDADKTAFHDGWFLTGDYGYLAEGELFVSGRKKDLIIVGGRNIYPQDLESISYEVPGVHAGRSVAFGVFNDETGTEDVFMVAESDSEVPAELERLADLVRQHVTKNSSIALRNVKVVGPKWIIKTSSGKTARAANRAKFLGEMGMQAR
jgi:fatty-acyl-CoA synthase